MVVRLALILATAAVAQTPTPKELGVYESINQLRADPSAWSSILKAERPWSPDKVRLFLGDDTASQTAEAVRDLEDAITALESIRGTLPHLELSPGLSRSAADHVRDSGLRGLVGHHGADGSTPQERIQRYGSWTGQIAENIVYSNGDARELVFQQLVDFGVANHGHRLTLLNPAWRFVGVACGAHATYHAMCVFDFASSYQEATASSRSGRSDRPGMNR